MLLAVDYGLNPYSAYRISRNEEKLTNYRIENPYSPIRKALKFSDLPNVDTALKVWFYQQRELNFAVSLIELKTIAMQFNERFFPDPNTRKKFEASVGYVQKFLKRNSIKLRNMHGENESCDIQSADRYKQNFPQIIASYSEEKIYNCDESGLIYFSLPTSTYVTPEEERVKGWKKAKDRITFMPCYNAIGSHKLPLVFVHKYENPRCFKGIKKSDFKFN